MIATLDAIFIANLVEFQQLADFLSNFIWTGSIELEANPVAGDSVQTRYVANFDMKSQYLESAAFIPPWESIRSNENIPLIL